jgi:hypothetical protein
MPEVTPDQDVVATQGYLVTDAVLLKAKLEYHQYRLLSADEVEVLSGLSDEMISWLLARPKPEDCTLSRWVAHNHGYHKPNDLRYFLTRIVGLWVIALSCRTLAPGVLSYYGVALPFIWRYHDRCVRTLRSGYYRLTDIPSCPMGNVVELLTRRYLFATMSLYAFIAWMSEYVADHNHVMLLEYIAYFALLANMLPVMYEESLRFLGLKPLREVDSPLFESLDETVRSIIGIYRLSIQLFECWYYQVGIGHLAEMHKVIPDHMWRFSAVVVHAAGILPREISSSKLYQLVFRPRPHAGSDVLQVPQATLSTLEMGQIALNALDGRFFWGLIDCFDTLNYARSPYTPTQKYRLLDRGIAVLSERPDFIPLVYRGSFKRDFLDDVRLVQFTQRMMHHLANNDRLRHRVVKCFDLFCLHQPSPHWIENRIQQILRSDFLDAYPLLYHERVFSFLNTTRSDRVLLMLLLRDIARVVVLGQNPRGPVHETLYILSVVWECMSHVSWSDGHDAQIDITRVFMKLSDYFQDVDLPIHNGLNLRQALTQLASIDDQECIDESPSFIWAIFHLVNTVCHSAGLISGLSTPAFKEFLSSQLFVRLDMDQLLMIEQIMGNQKTVKRPELVMNFIDMICAALSNDILGAFQRSFRTSTEFNDFIRLRAFSQGQKDDFSYLKTSSQFLETILRFLDHVDEASQKSPQVASTAEHLRAAEEKDRSTICCIALLFDYFGSGQIYGSHLLANMMYRNVFSNSAHLRWCLMFLEIILSSMEISMATFSVQHRFALPKNARRLGRSLYHVVTRSIFQLPRFVISVFQVIMIAVATVLYNLGQEKVLLLCTALMAALVITQSLAWPLLMVPLIACAIFYAYSALIGILEPHLKHLAVHVETLSQSARTSVLSQDLSSMVSASMLSGSDYADSDKVSTVSDSLLSAYSEVSQQDDVTIYFVPPIRS